MLAPFETLVVLEQRLAEQLLDFERLDGAWPRGRTAIERADTGRHRSAARGRAIQDRHPAEPHRPWPCRDLGRRRGAVPAAGS